MAIDTPHFAFPFRLSASGRAAMVVEQDTVDEIADCVEVLARTPIGSRIEVPDYGVEDPVFTQAPVDHTRLIAAAATWEPRADVSVEHLPIEQSDELRHKLRVTVQGGDLA